MTIRQDLANAANTVDGITAYEYYVQDTKPGTAWVRYDRTEYPNAFGGVDHWSVVVVLPTDMADAEKFIEAHVPAVKEAVSEHLFVTQVQPQRLPLPGPGTLVPCAFINGHREQE